MTPEKKRQERKAKEIEIERTYKNSKSLATIRCAETWSVQTAWESFKLFIENVLIHQANTILLSPTVISRFTVRVSRRWISSAQTSISQESQETKDSSRRTSSGHRRNLPECKRSFCRKQRTKWLPSSADSRRWRMETKSVCWRQKGARSYKDQRFDHIQWEANVSRLGINSFNAVRQGRRGAPAGSVIGPGTGNTWLPQ